MNPRKPGRIFWIGTFAVGIFSPGSGKRRVNSRMQELHRERVSLRDLNSELTSENQFLRRELHKLQGANNAFHVQDEINTGLIPAARADTESTMSLCAVN